MTRPEDELRASGRAGAAGRSGGEELAAEAAAAAERLRRILRFDTVAIALGVALHLGAGGLVAWRARAAGLEDWWLYALMALTTAVMITNYGRLGVRSGLLRQGTSAIATVAVVLAWAALLADRAAADHAALLIGIESGWLWSAVALELIVAALVVVHLLTLAPRLRKARQRARAGRAALRAHGGGGHATPALATEGAEEPGDQRAAADEAP